MNTGYNYGKKTDYETLRGKVKWCKIKTPNKFGRWSLDLYPDDASLAKIKKLQEKPGIKNVLKKDEDGYFMTFIRDPQKLMRGKMVMFPPIQVLDKDDRPTDVAIGNNSDCDVVLQVYAWGGSNNIAPGKGARLHALKVWNLVPFEIKNDFTDEERKQVSGLLDQPPMPQW